MDPRAPGHEVLLSISLPDGGRVVIQPFPREPSFVRDVARVMKQLDGDSTPESQLRTELQEGLRAWYPRVEIQPRNPLAGLVAQEHVWYALRDGRVRPASQQTNRLHAALSDARQTSAESDVAVEHAREALDFASQPRPRRSEPTVPSGARVGPDDEKRDVQADDDPGTSDR